MGSQLMEEFDKTEARLDEYKEKQKQPPSWLTSKRDRLSAELEAFEEEEKKRKTEVRACKLCMHRLSSAVPSP